MARTSLVNIMLSSALVVGFAVLVIAEVDDVVVSECPKNALRNVIVQIPHELDCTKYYTCLGTRKMVKECPFMDGDGNRLYFNPELHLCDWPWEAGCNLPLPIKTIKKTLFERKPIPIKCPRVDSKNEIVHLAHEWDCTKFYKCLQGKKLQMSCPSDKDGHKLYFNPSEQVCDWPYNVDCQMSQLTIKKALVACKPPTKCPRVDPKNETVHLAHEWDCTKFYKCLRGHKFLMSCPVDQDGNKLYFNACEQVCDWPYNVDCQPRNDVELLSMELSVLNSDYPTQCPKVDPPNEAIVLPYETDCTKFYSCNRGKKYVMDCPAYNEDGDKLCFNTETHQCDCPENTNCKQSELLLKGQLAEPQTSLPTKCPKYDSINVTVLLPHEWDCTKFYMCSHGKKVLKECPEMNDDGDRLYFNFEKQICDWPWNVDCKLPELKMRAGPVEIILPVPTKCPAKDSLNYTVHIAHEWDCTKFYKCLRGRKYLMDCPKIKDTDVRLEFNKYEQVCDWPGTPGCDSNNSNGPITTSSPPSSPLPSSTTPKSGVEGCLETCPNDDPPNFITALPHADCRKWCRCENHDVRVWPCPDNLHFSPTLRKCTSPELAGCTPKHPYRSRGTNDDDDEALMNSLGQNERFEW